MEELSFLIEERVNKVVDTLVTKSDLELNSRFDDLFIFPDPTTAAGREPFLSFCHALPRHADLVRQRLADMVTSERSNFLDRHRAIVIFIKFFVKPELVEEILFLTLFNIFKWQRANRNVAPLVSDIVLDQFYRWIGHEIIDPKHLTAGTFQTFQIQPATGHSLPPNALFIDDETMLVRE